MTFIKWEPSPRNLTGYINIVCEDIFKLRLTENTLYILHFTKKHLELHILSNQQWETFRYDDDIAERISKP